MTMTLSCFPDTDLFHLFQGTVSRRIDFDLLSVPIERAETDLALSDSIDRELSKKYPNNVRKAFIRTITFLLISLSDFSLNIIFGNARARFTRLPRRSLTLVQLAILMLGRLGNVSDDRLIWYALLMTEVVLEITNLHSHIRTSTRARSKRIVPRPSPARRTAKFS